MTNWVAILVFLAAATCMKAIGGSFHSDVSLDRPVDLAPAESYERVRQWMSQAKADAEEEDGATAKVLGRPGESLSFQVMRSGEKYLQFDFTFKPTENKRGTLMNVTYEMGGMIDDVAQRYDRRRGTIETRAAMTDVVDDVVRAMDAQSASMPQLHLADLRQALRRTGDKREPVRHAGGSDRYDDWSRRIEESDAEYEYRRSQREAGKPTNDGRPMVDTERMARGY